MSLMPISAIQDIYCISNSIIHLRKQFRLEHIMRPLEREVLINATYVRWSIGNRQVNGVRIQERDGEFFLVLNCEWETIRLRLYDISPAIYKAVVSERTNVVRAYKKDLQKKLQWRKVRKPKRYYY